MKKYISIIAVMALVVAGCAKQIEREFPEDSITQDGLVEYTIMVGRHIDPLTKAHFTSGDDTRVDFDWDMGDKIDVWDSNSGEFKTFTCVDNFAGGGDDAARFTASLPAGTYTWTTAYYPSGIASDETHVTFPASYADPSKVKPILVAKYPTTPGDDMNFNHLAAYVHFTVNNCPLIANKIVFSSDKVIAGTYEVNASTQALSNPTSTSNSVEISYDDWDNYTFTLPIVPGDEHTFSVDVKNGATTYFHQGGTADFDLPRKTVINMTELSIIPTVTLICDWNPSGIEMDTDDHGYYFTDAILTTDNHTIKFNVKYPTDVSIDYGLTLAGITDLSGTMTAGASNSCILENRGKYRIEFFPQYAFYWCGWSNPYYFNYNNDSFTFDGNYGLEHISGNYYVFVVNYPETNTHVRVYDLSSDYKTDAITITPAVENTVLVNLSDPSWSVVTSDPYAGHGFTNCSLAFGTEEITAVTDYWNWSDEIEDCSEMWDGFYGDYSLVLNEPTQIRMKEITFVPAVGLDPEEWSYKYFGPSASGLNLSAGGDVDVVEHGNPFTLNAGTYGIYYHYRLHKVFVVKKL